MASIEDELRDYAARRVNGTSPAALAMVARSAGLYRQTIRVLKRSGEESNRFWNILEVSCWESVVCRRALRPAPAPPAAGGPNRQPTAVGQQRAATLLSEPPAACQAPCLPRRRRRSCRLPLTTSRTASRARLTTT